MLEEEILAGNALDHICSATFTILVFPDYRCERIYNSTAFVETIIVPDIFLDGFVKDLGTINNLEEGIPEEDFETLRHFTRYFDYSEHDGYPMCYRVISAFFVDERNSFKTIVHPNFDNQIRARNLFSNLR